LEVAAGKAATRRRQKLQLLRQAQITELMNIPPVRPRKREVKKHVFCQKEPRTERLFGFQKNSVFGNEE